MAYVDEDGLNFSQLAKQQQQLHLLEQKRGKRISRGL
jgi:hypothetical protein